MQQCLYIVKIYSGQNIGNLWYINLMSGYYMVNFLKTLGIVFTTQNILSCKSYINTNATMSLYSQIYSDQTIG